MVNIEKLLNLQKRLNKMSDEERAEYANSIGAENWVNMLDTLLRHSDLIGQLAALNEHHPGKYLIEEYYYHTSKQEEEYLNKRFLLGFELLSVSRLRDGVSKYYFKRK